MKWASLIEQVRRQVNGGDPAPNSHPMEPEVVLVGGGMIGQLINEKFVRDFQLFGTKEHDEQGYVTFQGVPVLKDGTRHYAPLPGSPANEQTIVFYPEDRNYQFIPTELRALGSNDRSGITQMMAHENRYFTYFENVRGQLRQYFHFLPASVKCVDINMMVGSYEPKSYSENIPLPGELEALLLQRLVAYFTNQLTGRDDIADNHETSSRP